MTFGKLLKLPGGKLELYRIFTSIFIPFQGRFTILAFATDLVGIHCGTWFVIAGTKGRWQKILLPQFYITIVVCLVSIYLDPLGFTAPRQCLLVSQIVTTFMLEDTETYVPSIIRNILSFWYVFM